MFRKHKEAPVHADPAKLGTAGKKTEGDGVSAAVCVAPEIHSDRPPTPPEMKKFRKSRNEVGHPLLHPGAYDLNYNADERYGIKHEKDAGASGLLSGPQPSKLGEYLASKQEAVYHSTRTEPLGKSRPRGYKMPEVVNDKDFKFGVTTAASEDSKTILYSDQSLKVPATGKPLTVEEEKEITKPVERGYKWPQDPNQMRFGKVEPNKGVGVKETLLSSDVTDGGRVQPKHLQDYRAANHDALGSTKPLSGKVAELDQDPQFRFGKTQAGDAYRAADCIHSAYPPEQQQPDPDVGRKRQSKAYKPGELDENIVCGLSTVRTDRAPPKLKSVANTMNYGDELDSKGLLYPSKFAFDGLDDQEEFKARRDAMEIRDIFEKIGYNLTDAEFQEICESAVAANKGVLSVETFRTALNKIKHGL